MTSYLTRSYSFMFSRIGSDKLCSKIGALCFWASPLKHSILPKIVLKSFNCAKSNHFNSTSISPVPTTSSWKECARSNSLSIMLEIKEQVWEDSTQATEFFSCSTATSRKFTRSLIMPGLFSMIWLQQYAQNYTGIIFLFLLKNLIFQWLFFYQNEVFLFITKRNSICLIAFQWFPSGSGTQDKINVC